MKKLFALMLALCLMLGTAAMAESAVNWEDIAPQLEAAGITGEFVTFDQIAVKLFIPEGMNAAELPDDSFIGYFAADDGDAIAIQYVDVNGMDLDQYGFYLDLRKFGTTRHAGFGLGFERCVMYLTGISNIRDVLPYPRTVGNCEL